MPFSGYKKLVRLQILNRYSDWTFFYIAPESCSKCEPSESEFDKLQASWNPDSKINFIKVLIGDSERLEADNQFKHYPTIQYWHKSYPIEYLDSYSHASMSQFLKLREMDFSREIHNMEEFNRLKNEEGTRVVVFLESYNEELEFINEICKDYLGMVKFYHVWNDQL